MKKDLAGEPKDLAKIPEPFEGKKVEDEVDPLHISITHLYTTVLEAEKKIWKHHIYMTQPY